LHTPRWYSLVLLAAALLLFGSAACWQWQRAQFKDRRAREFAAALAGGAAPALDQVLTTPGAAEFALVRVAGRLDRQRLLLLDNQIRHGLSGVLVFAPLYTAGGHTLLVDLGFVARPDRQRPALIPEIAPLLRGRALLTPAPAAGLRLSEEVPAGPPRFPLLLTSIEPLRLRSLLDLPALGEAILKLPPDPASGFAREWTLPGLSADRHRGYALQWASFAIASVILFFLLHRNRRKSR